MFSIDRDQTKKVVCACVWHTRMHARTHNNNKKRAIKTAFRLIVCHLLLSFCTNTTLQCIKSIEIIYSIFFEVNSQCMPNNMYICTDLQLSTALLAEQFSNRVDKIIINELRVQRQIWSHVNWVFILRSFVSHRLPCSQNEHNFVNLIDTFGVLWFRFCFAAKTFTMPSIHNMLIDH